jgi:hypothetical protein
MVGEAKLISGRRVFPNSRRLPEFDKPPPVQQGATGRQVASLTASNSSPQKETTALFWGFSESRSHPLKRFDPENLAHEVA